jgi:MYXO-CTERM domain-containing protein
LILEAQRTTGDLNDGYADDLSLVVPEPGSALLGALALLTLVTRRLRRNRLEHLRPARYERPYGGEHRAAIRFSPRDVGPASLRHRLKRTAKAGIP